MKVCVYAHYKPTGEIFYIGKGTPRRSKSKASRNLHWQNIVKKHNGFESKILSYWGTDTEAFEHEKFLIACFKDMGYKLANITDGGQGVTGLKRPQSFKDAVSKRLKGVPKSESHRAQCAVANLGNKHKPETILRMKEIRKSGTHNSQPLNVCGKTFQSKTNFAKQVGFSPAWVCKMIKQDKLYKLEEAYKNATRQ